MNPRPNTSYLLARLPIGMSMFGHGFERIPKLQAFVGHVSAPFGKTMLPMGLVTLFAQALPFFELLTGVLILLGLFTRFGCILGVLIMLALIFGSSLLEQCENVFSQIVYDAYFALLYYFVTHNRYSFDKLLGLI